MSQIADIFKELNERPSPVALETFATNVDALSKFLSKEEMKTGLISCLSKILRDQKFSEIRRDESMLRLYKIMCRYSTSLGGPGIFEELYKKGDFKNSLKFYLQWAEQCAIKKMLDKFEKVLNRARDALGDDMDMSEIEAGFRDYADEYFEGKADHLFINPDDTMNLFRANPNVGKVKRRSSVCFLKQKMPAVTVGQDAFGPKTKTNVRKEIIDNDGYDGTSVEEFRLAMFNDNFGEEIHVEKKRKDSGFVFSQHKTDGNVAEIREKNRVLKEKNVKRELSALSEKTIEEEEESKRSRFSSPLIPTKDAHRPPLRTTGKAPATITLSSDTKSTDATDKSYNRDVSLEEIDNEKLRVMNAGRNENSRPGRLLSTSSASSTTRTAKSGVGLDLMAENNCLEAHAMFSDTVHLGTNRTMVLDDETVVADVEVPPPMASNLTTDYSVFCDPDPTMHLTQDRPKKVSNGLNVVYDEQAGEPEEDPTKEEEEDVLPSKSITTPPTFNNDMDMFEEDMLFGSGKPARGQIVTSTPAPGSHLMDVETYFGNKNMIEEQEEEEKPAFVMPVTGALNRMMRRKSVAPAAVPAAPVPAPKPVPQQANSSIDCLTENLGRRLSIGAEEIKQLAVEDSETTGIVNRRRSEIIKKGDINPWDETLRKKLMNLVRPPMNMHEFQERAPKIQALRDCEVGGEVFHIQTLIGQGGYAKVYRAINEDKKTVAVKYEVPSCSWEVYICDQMRNRLIKDGSEDRVKMADWCIMQVMDAYVFSTASLLVNEYHEYGTLLDYANNMKDPNWHMTCFLVTQMARIMKEVHECKIIHGDCKPDNFMITRKIDSGWGKDALMSSDTFVVKIIDWGRAIDMMPLKDQTFKGRAGTEGFDTPEMIDDRPWTYQADYFGFAATMAVVSTGKYAKLTTDKSGKYALDCDIKRRNVLRDTITSVISEFLNIPSCSDLPDWSNTIEKFDEFWEQNFEASAWRQAIGKFNEACDQAAEAKK